MASDRGRQRRHVGGVPDLKSGEENKAVHAGKWFAPVGLVTEPSQIYASGHVVPDPVGIPPLLRIDLHTVKLHAEVDVVTSGQSCLATVAHDLSAFNQVALMNCDLAEVAINRL
jgi:hypothetical protein